MTVIVADAISGDDLLVTPSLMSCEIHSHLPMVSLRVQAAAGTPATCRSSPFGSAKKAGPMS